MFVRLSTYIAAVSERANALGELSAQRVQLAEYRTTLDWMRLRVNQLEKERAILLREVTHLNVPTIEFAQATPMQTSVPVSMAMPNFEDVGDQAASQLGISHDANGEILFDDEK